MVEERLTRENLETEVKEIFIVIDNNQSFLLSGGAGSGKTFSLVQVIRQVIVENPTSKVACMTYTNAAVKEIESRVNHSNLNVSTIHDFLWDNIKHFQKELKSGIIALANDPLETKISIDGISPVPQNFFDDLVDGIQYTEYLRLKEGKISHDELLILSKHLFVNYPKLSDIIKDKYKFIFIDEYQDTSKAVVESFLTEFAVSKKRNIIGFFGDAMQAIYDNGIGNLDSYKGEGNGRVREIKKAQNRRNPLKIIHLANKIRKDGIVQEPSNDQNAPNMENGKVKEGSLLFLIIRNGNLENGRLYLAQKKAWDFNNSSITKELNLTHNLIAEKAGFKNLMEIYDGDKILSYRDRIKDFIKDRNITSDFSTSTFKDVIENLSIGKSGRELTALTPTRTMQEYINKNPDLYQSFLSLNYLVASKLYINKDHLLDDKKQNTDDEKKKGSKRDNLIRHLFKIQHSIALYKSGDYNEFLRITDYRDKIKSIEDKRLLRDNIESLSNVGEKTIEEIINEANEKGICIIDDKVVKYQTESEYFYNRIKDLKFKEFQSLFDYLEGKTPFSTQHKTKGTEFDNVLVILDNGGWNNYNFEYLFTESGTASVLERSQKIFYVCCTRTKENLAVIYNEPSSTVIDKAKEWFGLENVIDVDEELKAMAINPSE